MTLDFSIEKGRIAGDAQIENRETQIVNRKSQIVNRTAENEGKIINREQSIQRHFTAEPSSELNAGTSDPVGQVTIRGETGPMGTKADGISVKSISIGENPRNLSTGSGSIKVIDYGKSGSGVKDFPFIADTISKRFKDSYPDRARRMGWEGEVFLSFVISENGSVSGVEITKSAGRQIFDDHAREILKKTTFNEKLPYQLKIENCRVAYQLK